MVDGKTRTMRELMIIHAGRIMGKLMDQDRPWFVVHERWNKGKLWLNESTTIGSLPKSSPSARWVAGSPAGPDDAP